MPKPSFVPLCYRLTRIVGLVLCLGFLGCQETVASSSVAEPARPALPSEGPAVFVDVTVAAGIDFSHSFGDEVFSNLIEAVGGGVAWLDYDNDGHLDLYLTSGKHHPGVSTGEPSAPQALNRLFRNLGDGSFEDVTLEAGVGAEGHYSMGVTVGDYDNDGFPDIYVCNHGPNLLYRNRGDGSFEEKAGAAGVADPRSSVAAAWLDYDRDGYLDLYVGNYIRFDPSYGLYYAPDGFPGPLAYPAEADALFRNQGDGSFVDVAPRLGTTLEGRTMGVIAADLDGDGDDEIYVSNDAMENFLYLNEDGKGFVEVGLTAGVAYNAAGDSTAHMAVDVGDYDSDGRPDIFVSDSSISSLFHNEGDGWFVDVSIKSGIGANSAQFVGWGSFFFDYDNDGDLDILKVNADLSRQFGQEPQLFANLDGDEFADASQRLGSFFDEEWMSRGAAYADYDNDGDLDFVVSNLGGQPILLRNDVAQGGFLQIQLTGRGGPDGSNRDGLGAAVTVVADGRSQTAQRRSGAGYLSQNSPILHFGLAGATAVERVEVSWPSGRRQVLSDVAKDQLLRLVEPDA